METVAVFIVCMKNPSLLFSWLFNLVAWHLLVDGCQAKQLLQAFFNFIEDES